MQVVTKSHAIFSPDNLVWHISVKNRIAAFEALQFADTRIISLQDARGREQLVQYGNDFLFARVCTLTEGLKNQPVRIAIHHNRGQQVRFSVDQTVTIGVFDNHTTVFHRRAYSGGEKIAVDGNVVARQQPNGDLGTAAEKRDSEKVAALVADAHHVARFGVGAAHVAAIDPEMAGANAVRSAPADFDLASGHLRLAGTMGYSSARIGISSARALRKPAPPVEICCCHNTVLREVP